MTRQGMTRYEKNEQVECLTCFMLLFVVLLAAAVVDFDESPAGIGPVCAFCPTGCCHHLKSCTFLCFGRTKSGGNGTSAFELGLLRGRSEKVRQVRSTSSADLVHKTWQTDLFQAQQRPKPQVV